MYSIVCVLLYGVINNFFRTLVFGLHFWLVPGGSAKYFGNIWNSFSGLRVNMDKTCVVWEETALKGQI